MRQAYLLKNINPDGVGLEIGLSFRPVAPKAAGYNTTTVDVLNKEQLIALARTRDVDTSEIEEVDFIWDGRPLSTVIGRDACFDWIIASHVIEHVPDMIGFLQECSKLLKNGGVLSLAVPDKRFCFDYFRPLTPLASLVDAYTTKQQTPSAGAVVEYFLYNCRKNMALAWDKTYEGSFSLTHTDDFVREMHRKALEGSEYIDIHRWCFTPAHFRLLLADLRLLQFVNVSEVDFTETIGHEFFVALAFNVTDSQSSPSRLELMQKMTMELEETQPCA